jgi:lipopolysaccharide cholinephosphotransferase
MNLKQQFKFLMWFNIVTVATILVLCAFLYVPVKKFLKAGKASISHQEPSHTSDISSSNWQTKTDKEIAEMTFISEDQVQEMYQMLKDTTELLHNAGIAYSMDGGTMLGAVRHQGLIPWDDDMDLIILSQDEVKLTQLTDIFKKLGYSLVYSNDIYKVSKIGNPIINSENKFSQYFTFPWIDIFVMHHNKSSKQVEYWKLLNKEMWPKEWFPENEFFPLKEYKFGPLMIYGMSNPEWYFNHYYGPSWPSEASISIKHYLPGVKPKYFETITRNISGIFAAPALPKFPLLDRVHYLKDQVKQDF